MTSLLELEKAWQKHPKFKNRALGGRRALDGFYYQLAVSLDRFFVAVLKTDNQAANLAFEGLSDLTERHDNITYLVQIKTTLTRESLSSALTEALAIDEFLEECFENLRENVRFRIITRRVRGNIPTEPHILSATDLALDPITAQRWNIIKNRCLPVEVDCAPEVRLAKGRDDEPEWAFVWRKLIDQNFEPNTLLPRGRDWLKGHQNRPGSHLVLNAIRRS